ncbi:hypothetical protein [Listeria ilorinensis]|uniref:hypothetical protein n=1 Tax=Listeria ilorinensis TaxID=2867439 RepID=UPI001EF606E5|nr:hypothetical protein [Listeria ilorinensis]
MKKGLFWFSYILAGLCTILTAIAIVIGFIHHMHDTGAWRSVIQILETPITGFIKMTNGYIQKSVIEVILLVIVSYILPIYFFIATHFIRRNRTA